MAENKSYKQIVKSTSIFGGSQIINILIGFIRTKIIAILLGTMGVGMIGMYQTITEMIRSIAMLGLDTSGIRDIASANNRGNKKMINESIAILKKWMNSLSVFAALLCIVFAYPIAKWSFGEAEANTQVFAIAALSICILFTMLTTGRSAVMQGLRKIPEMVKSNIVGNFSGLLISIPLYFFFGIKGVIPSLILSAIILFVTTLYYSKNLGFEDVHISYQNAYAKGKNMFRMGIFIVSASVFQTASMFILRSFIIQRLGLDGFGVFMAAWTITNIYLTLILRSMGADFYPRLCAVVSSNIRVRRLVNEQTHIVLIVSTPIIIGMLLASDFIIYLQYTSKFMDAASLLRWQIVGTFLKVVSWPMGFILLAKGKGKLFFITEALFFVVYLISSYMLFPIFGLDGTGMGYFFAYIVYLISMIVVTTRICNFKWRMSTFRLGIVYLLAIITTFYATNFLHNWWIALIIFLLVSVLSIQRFNSIIPLRGIAKRFLKK